MQSKTPPPVPSVVKREDKIETMRAFIHAFWLQPRAETRRIELSLVARSAESPVARALAALNSELVSRGVLIRAIFSQLESEKTSAGWTVAGPEIGFHRELRWAKNPRLADAHEQLVLGPERCWVGDCMRRDPSRRDAYEQYVAADARTAATIATSFERLWGASVPLLIRTPGAMAKPIASSAPLSDLAGLIQHDDNAGPLASPVR